MHHSDGDFLVTRPSRTEGMHDGRIVPGPILSILELEELEFDLRRRPCVHGVAGMHLEIATSPNDERSRQRSQQAHLVGRSAVTRHGEPLICAEGASVSSAQGASPWLRD